MVQVLGQGTPKGPSFSQRLNSGLGKGLEVGQQLYQKHQQKQAIEGLGDIYNNPELSEQQRLVEVYKRLGTTSPEIAKNLGSQLAGLGQKNMANKATAAEDQQRYDVIKKNFGERAAEIYRSAPEGGKTQLLGSLLEARQRGLDIDEFLGEQPLTQQPTERISRDQPATSPEMDQEKPVIKAIDYDKGLLPKERVRRQEDRYAKNLPLYQESQKKLLSLEAEKDRLNILEDLSPQIGTMARLNINPQTGELFLPAAASPEVQRYVKTLNDFTTSAKDSYGSRVTNFDLQQYMKRLPTLANSEEGRKQIVKQMKILNEINSLRESALQDVIEEHGGIRNIDYDKAEKLADKHSKPQIEALRKQFKSIDNDLEKQYQQKIQKQKAIVPKGHVAVMRADGTQGYIPQSKLKKFLSDNKGNQVL